MLCLLVLNTSRIDADDADVLIGRSPPRSVPGDPGELVEIEGDAPGQPLDVLRPNVIVVAALLLSLAARSSCRRFQREPVSCASCVEGAFPLFGSGGGGEVPGGCCPAANAADAARRCSDNESMLLPELTERGCETACTDEAEVEAGEALNRSADGLAAAARELPGTAVGRAEERT